MNKKRITPMTVLAACLVVFITASLFTTSAIASADRTIIHESADILYYEDGAPLKLYWNFLDSSAESSFENVVRSKENILSGQTQIYYPYEYDME